MDKIIPVILCGGSGKRLWPLSNKKKPKQFLRSFGQESFLQQTVKRAVFCSGASYSDIVTVTTPDLQYKTKQHLQEIHPDTTTNILVETCQRNTAPAIAMAAQYILNNNGENTMMWVLPSDHIVKNQDALKKALHLGCNRAQQGWLVTFGINPAWPETGYGYIKTDTHNNILKFCEKPDKKTAIKYLKENSYHWNSGMFLGSPTLILKELAQYAPNIIEDGSIISFDKAVMENTDKAVLIPCDIGWSDIGTWPTFWRFKIRGY